MIIQPKGEKEGKGEGHIISSMNSMNYSLVLSPKMTFHGFQDAYLSLAPSYIPLGATLDECLILSVLCVKLTISCLNAGLFTPGKNLQGEGMTAKVNFIFAITFLSLTLSDSPYE